MSSLERSALVNFSADQMYSLVNDIEAYPEFMPGCVGAKITNAGSDWVEARLELSKAGIKYNLVSRNQLQPPTRIDMHLVEGPFSTFQGSWTFQPLSDEACKVSLQLQFQIKSKLLGAAATTLFEQVANQQVDALCERAKYVYSPGSEKGS